VIDDLAGDGPDAGEDDVRDAPIAAGERLRLRPDGESPWRCGIDDVLVTQWQ
jgi:hypothetical protein